MNDVTDAKTNLLSRVPGFDPRAVPVVADDAFLPPVPGERLLADALRRRFAQPPERWRPERVDDQFRLRPGGLRPASVLVPIVLHETPTVLLTQRTSHLHDHAGQVAFPGGRRDPQDLDAVDTALRETHEEIGLPRERVDVIGHLPDYHTGTGYRVTPVVALVEPGFDLKLDAFEVEAAFEVPLRWLMDPASHRLHRHDFGDGQQRTFWSMAWHERPVDEPAAPGREFFIWGATAAMLRNLYRLLAA